FYPRCRPDSFLRTRDNIKSSAPLAGTTAPARKIQNHRKQQIKIALIATVVINAPGAGRSSAPGADAVPDFDAKIERSGERGDWTIRTTSPGNITKEDQTTEKTWYPLLSEMLTAAFENASRRRLHRHEVTR
ncbi:MAG: hypothetical protein WCB23_08330, partial [Pseudolabrys sp.]